MERIYTTRNLYLKILDESFASSVLFFCQNNREYFQPWEPLHLERYYTTSYQAALLTAEHTLMSRSQAIRFFVFEKEHPDVIIGSVNFYSILHSPNLSCKLGYKLDHSIWHKGYAYEAISFLLPIIFHSYNINRIEADIMPSNYPSLNLIKRLGFTYEGVARKSCEINGNLQDHHRFSLLVSDSLPEIIA